MIQKHYEKGLKGKLDYYKNAYANKNFEAIKDSLEEADLMFETKYLKRKVYGGGGIHPDYETLPDTTGDYKFMSKIISKRIPFE